VLKAEGGITIILHVDSMSIVYENERADTRKVYRLEDTGKGMKIDLFGTTKLSTFLERRL